MISFSEFTLDNGLQVIVHEDKQVPVAVLDVLYKVGSKNEHPNKTGFAHLFEHMMFSGTDLVPNYDEPIQSAGGENNAFTNSDYSNYYCYGPAENLETFLWIEADRWQNLRLGIEELQIQQKEINWQTMQK